jgi:hypothetical protein
MSGMEPTVSAEVGENPHPCACGHDIRWHHVARGCGYHGHGPHACPCRLTHDEALAAYVQAARDEERARAWEEAHAKFCPRGGGSPDSDVCSTHLRPGDRHLLATFERGAR